MKKLLYYICFLFLLFLPFTINADYGIVIEKIGINIRSDATADSTILGAVPYNLRVELLETTKYSDKGTECPAGWYKISYNGISGYACSSYLNIFTNSSSGQPYTARVNCYDYLSVWDKTVKGNVYDMQDRLINGTTFTIEETLPGGSGCDARYYSWYKIRYHGNKIGYVCSNDVAKYEELTISSANYTEAETAYANSLLQAGFTKNYIPYLIKMKRDHPNWEFKPLVTNIEWSSFVSKQTNMNLVHNSVTTYLSYYSTMVQKSGNYYYTNYATNAFFLDPRNFLSDRFIFMFENLSYDKTIHTDAILQTFLDGTWLNTAEYRGYFMKAAENYKVSPTHLVARVIQEGGSKSDYGPITGTYNGSMNGISLYGYYNFYNINAPSDWVQGLCFASGNWYDSVSGTCQQINSTKYGRPWNTREKAILGGAEFLATDYIGIGQDTLYSQKFDIVNTNLHQYMENIQAPSSEAQILFGSYKEKEIENKNYTFKIPVYKNMPDYVSLPSIASTNNNLSSIKIDGHQIENFDTDVIEYTYYINKDTSSINISATTSDSKASVTGMGTISITNNETNLTLIVKAESGDTKTYKIKVIRVDNVKTIEQIISTLSTKINGNNMSAISPKTDSSSLINSIKKADPASRIVYKNSSGTQITGSVQIKTGDSINITSSNNEVVTYKLIVNGDNNGDGDVTILDLLRIQKHILNSSKLTDIYYLAGDTNNDNNVDILDLLRVQKHILGSLKL